MSDQPPARYVRTLDHLVDFVDTASIGLHWVSSDGTIVWANPADYEPLGYSADEYIGHNIAEFHADTEAIQDILKRLSEGERLNSYEARLRCKDGSIRFVEISSSVLFEDTSEGRKFVHTRCYTRDITERKRMEQARDRFIAIIGHDLRNPLGAIAIGADFLMKAPDVPEAHRKTATRLANVAARMSRVINELMEVARYLGGRMPVNRRPADFGELCRRSVDEVSLGHPDASIEVRLSGDLTGEWDAERVAQALSNMLGNALKHGHPPISLSAEESGDDIVLKVSNAGPTIPPQNLQGLFEPFSPTSNKEGYGLGLFIVREIIAAHGGTISVESSNNTTVFTSRWPRAARPESGS